MHFVTYHPTSYACLLPFYSGKGLGGSYGMNLMVWHKPPKEEMDGKSTSTVRHERTFTYGFVDIERLGNPGWNWEN